MTRSTGTRSTGTRSTGTLMWIGSRTAAEISEAFSFCQRHASQLALRESLADAVLRPADAVTNIVVARRSRTAEPASQLDALAERYPQARRSVLIGSSVEGEARTGCPWNGWNRIRWHSWNQILPNWFLGPPGDSAPLAGLTLVVAASQQHADPLMDLLQQRSVPSLWLQNPRPSDVQFVQRVIWDDSAAPATTASVWQQRLRSVHMAPQAQHAWAVNVPRAHELASARRGGIDVPLSKPYLRDPLIRFLSLSAPPS